MLTDFRGNKTFRKKLFSYSPMKNKTSYPKKKTKGIISVLNKLIRLIAAVTPNLFENKRWQVQMLRITEFQRIWEKQNSGKSQKGSERRQKWSWARKDENNLEKESQYILFHCHLMNTWKSRKNDQRNLPAKLKKLTRLLNASINIKTIKFILLSKANKKAF